MAHQRRRREIGVIPSTGLGAQRCDGADP